MYPYNDSYVLERSEYFREMSAIFRLSKYEKSDIEEAMDLVKSENPKIIEDGKFWGLVENHIIQKIRNQKIDEILTRL